MVSPDAVPTEWTEYVRRSNIHIGEAQAEALSEAIRYCGDAGLSILELQTQISAEVLGRWGVPSTVPASQDYLRNGKPPRASPVACEKLLFKFDPKRDEPVKEKHRLPPPAEARDAPAAGGAVSDASRAEGAFGGGVDSAGGLSRPAPEAQTSSFDHVDAPSAADSVQAAAKPKKSTGPDLNDSAIKALLEKRAELARITAERELQAKAALSAKQKSSAAPPPGQGMASKQQGKGGKVVDGGAAGGKAGKTGQPADAHPTPGQEAVKASKEHSASKHSRKAGPSHEAEALGGAVDEGQVKESKEQRKSKSKRGDEDEEERRRRHEKKAAKRMRRELEAQAGAQASASDAAAPSLKIRVKLSSSNPP
uniref:Uncharacterized protein n=1 Tax=Cryptomonas curvata TaxID=233186 RepID=A0A7S0QHV2_9CRYP